MITLLLPAGCSCGDDDGDTDNPDDPDADTGEPDSGGGGGAYSGVVQFAEISAPSMAAAGDGIVIQPRIFRVEDVVAPIFEEIPGTPFGCKVTERTPEQAADVGVDIGEFQFTLSEGPTIPPCRFIEGQGYRCIGVMGAGGEIAAEGGPLFSYTNDAITFTEDDTGRVLAIQGATGGNNGLFPIVEFIDANTVHFMSMSSAAETLAGSAMVMTVAGAPMPTGMDDPIPDTATLDVTVTPADGVEIEAIAATDFNIGDGFVLDDESAVLINAIPTDGSAFAIGCGGDGGTCNTAMATIVNISTTDGTPSPMNPFPEPETKSVEIQCIVVSGQAMFNEAISQYIEDSGATAVRAFVVRAYPNNIVQDNLNLVIGTGHAMAGFTIVE